MRKVALITVVLALWLSLPFAAWAQEATPTPTPAAPTLTIATSYPSQMAEFNETVTFKLELTASGKPQIVRLDVEDVPEGWTTSFRGGGRVVRAVYVGTDNTATVDLRVELPKDVTPGTYSFTVVGRSDDVVARLPLELTIQEKLPPQLSFTTDLPTLKGNVGSTIRFNTTLKNEGDSEMSVNLAAEAPEFFQVTFKLFGQEVTSIPLKANESKSLTVEVLPPRETQAGKYPITVRADGGVAQASLDLTADVAGRPDLSISMADGRISGEAYAGKETTFKLIVRNTGTDAARNVEMSASQPTGWSVEFDPKTIAEVPAGQQVEVTAKIKPADKAVAGDYMVTLRARPEGQSSESVDFRVTVLTSTLWGVVGLALIAAAVVLVGLAVARFGRR
ncbi:MAG: NEW3 domain-containing protein [Anaerolineae bacterium]